MMEAPRGGERRPRRCRQLSSAAQYGPMTLTIERGEDRLDVRMSLD